MKTYHPSKIRPIIQIAARMIKTNPRLLDDEDLGLLRAQLSSVIPELADPTHCPNCGASMLEEVLSVKYHDFKLVEAMAEIVERRMHDGVQFTDANKTAVNKHPGIAHQAKVSTGRCHKLGLIAYTMKPVFDEHGNRLKNEDGTLKSVRDGTKWSITTTGWALLRNEPVIKSKRVFREQILDRDTETITASEIVAAKGEIYTPEHAHRWYELGNARQGMVL